ncbi:MAG: hypothetical protein DRH57_08050, partial [Candidatus Cloacimonadota bacterium]
MGFLLFATMGWSLNYKKVIKNQKATANYKKSNFDKAEQLYKENALENPKDDKVHFNLGDSYYKNKKYDDAIIEFQNSLRNGQMDSSIVYYNLGNSYFQKKDIEKALEYYKKSILKDPHNLDAKYNYELAKQYLA